MFLFSYPLLHSLHSALPFSLHSSMSKFYHFISLYILMFFLLPRNSRPLDPHFQACTPRMCGALTIRFPFYIEGPQEPYCGYPGFNVSCYNNQTAIHLSDDSYVIQNISYEDQSLRIVNSAFLDEVFDCFPSIHNFTLDDDSMFSSKYGEIFLFYNCRDPKLPKSPTYKEMICEHEGKRGMVVAVYDHDFMGYGKMPYECQGVVTVPYRGEDGSDIEGVMRKGLVLNWYPLNCSACVDSGGFCGYNGSTSESKCYCPDRVHRRSCHPGEQEKMEKEPEKKGLRKRKLKLILGLAIPGGILLLLAAILFWCRKQLRLGSTRFLRRTISSDTEKSDLENDGMYFNVPIFTYKELEEATNKFDGAREPGDGGFGTVYYGKLKDGREVAVKRLYERNYKRVEQFMNEVEILTHLRHPNLVSLYGCTSRHCRNLILVYEYVPNGTLSDHLYGDPAQSQVLPWATRLRIAIETATALSYLHTSGIIHRDVKTNNILLDNNFSVKVADFGLSRLFPTDVTHVSTAPQGTPGYLDPEYHQCYQLTDKSDVYNFGVVLIELISSLPAVDINRHRHEINLSNYAMNRIQQSAFEELVDPQLGFKSDYRVQKTTTMVAELAFQCLQNDKDFRPTMDEVVQALKSIESTDFVVSWDTKNEDVESLKPMSEDTETEDVGSLKNMKKLASASSVEDQWASTNTTPSTSN